MDHAALLTGPGRALFALFVGAGERFDEEALEELAPILGVAFWLGVVLLASLARHGLIRWRRARPGEAAAADDGSARAPPSRPASVGWWTPRLDSRCVVGTVWRAEVVHLVLYVLLPLLWEGGRYLLIVLFLPIMVVGFGNTTIHPTDGMLDHLKQPTCWVVAAPCDGPRSRFLHDRVQNNSACTPDGRCRSEAILEDHRGWGWRVVWLGLSLVWIALWRRRGRGGLRGRPERA